jgi:hypothetical protein
VKVFDVFLLDAAAVLFLFIAFALFVLWLLAMESNR